MSYENILVSTEGRVGIVQLNRPAARNALNGALMAELVAALAAFDSDAAIGCMLITGSDKAFAAGADVKEMADRTYIDASLGKFLQGWSGLSEARKPVIAAVNGSALGGGFELMLTTDLVVAADHARFGLPEVTRGLLAAGGGTRLPRRIPLQVALEMGLTGQPISADRALQLGLINRVVAGHEVLDTALGLAAVIAANGPRAVQVTKRMMRAAETETFDQNVHHVFLQLLPLLRTDDFREGVAAYMEKRSPKFTGR